MLPARFVVLTDSGRELEPVLTALGLWAVQWQFDRRSPKDLDPVTLTWWMHRSLDAAELPNDRVVIQLDHLAPARMTLWIVLDRGEASVCRHHPGYDIDLILRGATQAFASVYDGLDSWPDALAAGRLTIDGPPRLTRQVPRWFLPSNFAAALRARAATATP